MTSGQLQFPIALVSYLIFFLYFISIYLLHHFHGSHAPPPLPPPLKSPMRQGLGTLTKSGKTYNGDPDVMSEHMAGLIT